MVMTQGQARSVGHLAAMAIDGMVEVDAGNFPDTILAYVWMSAEEPKRLAFELHANGVVRSVAREGRTPQRERRTG